MTELVYIVVQEDGGIESVHHTVSSANQAIKDLEREYNGQYLFRAAPLVKHGERINVSNEDG